MLTPHTMGINVHEGFHCPVRQNDQLWQWTFQWWVHPFSHCAEQVKDLFYIKTFNSRRASLCRDSLEMCPVAAVFIIIHTGTTQSALSIPKCGSLFFNVTRTIVITALRLDNNCPFHSCITISTICDCSQNRVAVETKVQFLYQACDWIF